MRVAFWRDGGEPQPTRIAIFAPCHRFRRADINFLVTYLRVLARPFTSLAGRTMHRRRRGYGEQNSSTSASAPFIQMKISSS